MGTKHFEDLQTVWFARESREGCAEICREPNGTHRIKLRIRSHTRQREVLGALDESIPVRLENGDLELLLPWYEGVSLRQWLYQRTPTLGQRRDACLSLLEQQLEMGKKLPPCLTALCADAENLAIENAGMRLQYLPALRGWEPDIAEPEAVCAVAAVIGQVLASNGEKHALRQEPEELQLLYCRQRDRDYTSWSQLQRDVAAIPEDLPHIKPVLRSYILRAQNFLARWSKYILGTLAAILLAAALLSLLSAYLRSQSGLAWQGMPLVGGHDLRKEEGGG